MDNQMVKQMIRNGVDPSHLGQAAHNILDYVEVRPSQWWVRTPRNGWHRATKREIALIAVMEDGKAPWARNTYAPERKLKRSLRRAISAPVSGDGQQELELWP